MDNTAEKLKNLEMLVSAQQAQLDLFPNWLTVIAVAGVVLTMFVGVVCVFCLLKHKNHGFGPNSLKALGTILFIPSLVLLAILTEFKTETLAALLGTVAGYLLSTTEDKTATSKPTNGSGANG
ncbi:hypothetical protein ACCH75_004643 [Vibrio parahaemolyticus]|uniref:hypothetical protein n=2 Tax=Vibrio parahaemolyticus TaxID=670 RepID=UPI00193FE017|nr:hypothetical protein [Vibrio parahaemolyticus]HCM1572611.1 hypothetical protein [Vibrio parahaemolyticus]